MFTILTMIRILLTPVTFLAEQIGIIIEEATYGNRVGAAGLRAGIIGLGALIGLISRNVFPASQFRSADTVMVYSWILSMIAYAIDYFLIRRSEQSKIVGTVASMFCSLSLGLFFGALTWSA